MIFYMIIEKEKSIIWDREVAKILRSKLTGSAYTEAKKIGKKIQIKKIWYRSQGHLVVGYMVEPKGKYVKLPCIIYNRGGSGEFGSINLGKLFLALGKMASWGYVVIASQYSGNDGGEGKDEMGGSDIKDVLNLYKILQEHPKTDLSRIGMYGGSRGGMMTYLCLAKVKWIRAAVCVAGLANLFRQKEKRPEMDSHFKKMFGGSKRECLNRSAVFWTKKISKKAPILLMHGSADWRVSPLDSLELSEKLFEANIPHKFILFEGADHGLTEFQEEKWKETRDWFDKFLKKGNSLPNLKPHGS
ncbi:hypothetical protein FJZ48_03540 [Candidatus Uhrbacteria bacterium]|nr:hypothetical protein [Candidatus Uhrbacteria bacterium]